LRGISLGSRRDIDEGSKGWQARIINKISSKSFLKAFRMTFKHMREFITLLNTKRPKLIIAYVDAIYEMAKFA
jgi:phenylacetate-CoA ligase